MSLGCPVCQSLSTPFLPGRLDCGRPDCPSLGATTSLPIAVGVTDHAVLRYLERFHGVNVEAVRAHIAATCQRGAETGARFVQWRHVRFVLDGSDVLTTLPREWLSNLDNIQRRKFGPRAQDVTLRGRTGHVIVDEAP